MSSEWTKFIKGQLSKILVTVISNKIDGHEIGQKIDQELDKVMNVASSEHIQRKNIWRFIKELSEGLFDEDLSALRVELHNWKSEVGHKGVKDELAE